MGGVRLFVRDALAVTNASEEVVDCAELLVSELAANAMLHTRTDVQVTVRLEGASLRAEVRDWNPRLPQPCLPAEGATTGRGLQVVDAIASSSGVEHDADGKVVWFELHVPRPGLTNGTVNNGASP